MTHVTAPEAILQQLRSNRRLLITSHLNPDGDAIGTSIGLARLLRRLGKATEVWLHDHPASLYSPLVESEPLHTGSEPPPGFPESFDAAVVLECPTLDRCGLEAHLGSLPLINIDHHLGNELYGVVNWVDSASPAVAEMILRVAQGLHIELDEASATPLFLGLSTDTGGFRFGNATERAFEAAAQLVRGGARPEEVARWLYESRPVSSVRLIGEALQTLRLSDTGRVATIVLTKEMFDRCGASEGDSEGLIDYPRSIAGVDTVGMVREVADGGFKVSLRSHGTLDVEKIARRLGGGGHRNAAGFRIAGGDIESARMQVEQELEQLVGSD